MSQTKQKFTVLKQICELIPGHLVSKLAKKYDVDQKSRAFTPWSHVVSMLFAQLSHALSLNDICDTLGHHKSVLTGIRRAHPPSRNGLSHANKERDSAMAEALFWEVLESLQNQYPGFWFGHKSSGFPRRFKRMINVVDSTTIQLVSNCINWAKHRRRKAAAKCHLRLNLASFLPRFAIVKEAGTHDSSEAKALYSDIKSGEIIIFDKAYIDYEHLYELDQREIFWVTRSKDNMAYDVVDERPSYNQQILTDQIIRLTSPNAQNDYPKLLRLVTALVEVNGELKVMTFLTNNMTWAASSVCDLYKARWSIEVFFKQLKQTLQLANFLGYSKHAVRWQIWMALLTYVLLRYLAFVSKWKGSFSRLFTTIRGVLWSKFDIFRLLKSYGTADDPIKITGTLYQAYLPGCAF